MIFVSIRNRKGNIYNFNYKYSFYLPITPVSLELVLEVSGYDIFTQINEQFGDFV